MFQETSRQPGDRWMIRGPAEYVPSTEVEVVTKRTAIPLDENEGIYVRDIKTGKVRAVTGETYMLNQDEELWAKVCLHDSVCVHCFFTSFCAKWNHDCL